jgi:hypothetical protein
VPSRRPYIPTVHYLVFHADIFTVVVDDVRPPPSP